MAVWLSDTEIVSGVVISPVIKLSILWQKMYLKEEKYFKTAVQGFSFSL